MAWEHCGSMLQSLTLGPSRRTICLRLELCQIGATFNRCRITYRARCENSGPFVHRGWCARQRTKANSISRSNHLSWWLNAYFGPEDIRILRRSTASSNKRRFRR